MTPFPTLIAELEEALKAATPEPWNVGDGAREGSLGYVYCDDALGSALFCVPSMSHEGNVRWEANALLIALMRNSLPTLIESLKRQGEALDEIAYGEIHTRDSGKTFRCQMSGRAMQAKARAALKETTDV